jgi:PDZ domain-containing secreted protein
MSTDIPNMLRYLDLSGVAITAAIRTDGALRPVGGIFKKLVAAARETAFPRIRIVVVAEDQDLGNLDLVQDTRNENRFKAPNADFYVLRAGTIEDAVHQLRLQKGDFEDWGVAPQDIGHFY